MAYKETEDKKKKAKFSLQDVLVREISLVGKPAIGRTYLLTKAANDVEETVETTTDTKDAGTVPANQLGVNVMNEKLLELLKSVESEEIREALVGAFEVILTNKEAVPEDIMKGFYEIAEYEIPTVEKEVEKIIEKEVIKEIEVEKIVEVEKSADDPKEAILKGLDPNALELFKEQEAKIEKAETAEKEAIAKAEAEEQSRINQEYVKKASDNYDKLSFTAEEFGPVLKSVTEKLDEAESKIVMKVFETAQGAVIATKQDEEFGNTGSGDGDEDKSEPKYINLARAMVKAGEAKTEAKAVVELMRTKPELFEEEE